MVRNVTFLKSGFFAQKETKEICLRSCVWSVQHCYLQKIMVAGHEKLDKSQCCQPIANEQFFVFLNTTLVRVGNTAINGHNDIIVPCLSKNTISILSFFSSGTPARLYEYE